MTYDEIIAALRRGKCNVTADGLDNAVDEEAKALADLPNSPWSKRDAGKAAREAARQFYAEDITSELTEPQPLTPARVLGHRRVHITWAVAEVLRTNGLA